MYQPGAQWLYNTSAQVLGVLLAARPAERFPTSYAPASSSRWA